MQHSSDRSRPSLPRPGLFEIAHDRKVSGTVTVAGRNTRLYVWDDSVLEIMSGSTILGVLDDLTKISLIGCYTVDKRHIENQYGTRYMCDILPEYVILGEHIERGDRSIEEITFKLRDRSLFNDSDAFGSSFFNDIELFQQIAQSTDRKVESVEEFNWIQYYTGKSAIFRTDTVLGQVAARHEPSMRTGVSVHYVPTSDVVVSVRPYAQVTVVEALTRMETVLQFLDSMAGRTQITREIRVHRGHDRDLSSASVNASILPDHRTHGGAGDTSPLYILIDPVKETEIFCSVLTEWLGRYQGWHEARSRLSLLWSGVDYDEDRIVRSANAFDLIPKQDYAGNVSVSADMKQAVKAARALFKPLPDSEERHSVLSALGRVGEWNLKRKVRYRTRNLMEAIGAALPMLCMVTDEAVNFRNYYVHGSLPRVERNKVHRFLPFLTDALEFVFVASDLVDAGWDISNWLRKPKPTGHPFQHFLMNYRDSMERVRAAIASEK